MKFEKKLQDNGYNVTETRHIIFSALKNSEFPVTAQELQIKAPLTDRATIYRTLALFQRLGIVLQLPKNNTLTFELTDKYRPHHHHLVCDRCDSVIDVASKELEKTIQKISKQHSFTPTSHAVEITGICSRH